MAKPAKLPSIRFSAIPSVVQRVHKRPSTPRTNAADPLQLRHGDDGCAEFFLRRSRRRDSISQNKFKHRSSNSPNRLIVQAN